MSNHCTKYFLFFALFLSVTQLSSQTNIGLPFCQNYTKEIYKGGLRNWSVAQDSKGIVYFANDQGLLSFDGFNWNTYPVDNKTITRSLFIDNDIIYVGSQGDIGYFEANENGILKYHSLLGLMTDSDKNFGDVWRINKYQDQIIFRTSDRVLALRDSSLRILGIQEDFSFQFSSSEKIYLHQLENQLMGFDPIHFENSYKASLTTIITGIVPIEKDLLFFTSKGEIYISNGESIKPWNSELSKILYGRHFLNASRIDVNRFVIGTLSNGLYIVNNQGQILSHLNSSNGLQSNEVFESFIDKGGNLWLCMSRGIDFVEISSVFTQIIPDKNSLSPGYATYIHDNKLYLGTIGGLYFTEWENRQDPLSKLSFELVENSKGQVWNLQKHNNELLLCHHEGTFRIEGNKAVQISNIQGTWGFLPLGTKKDILLEGKYHGLNTYKFQNGHWEFNSEVKNMIDESCRILAKDNKNSLWVANPYRGVYKIELNSQFDQVENIKLYDQNDGFPSNWIHVFEIRGNIVFTTENGVFEYNEKYDRFQASKFWSSTIDSTSSVQRLFEDDLGNIWFVIENEMGIFHIEDYGVEKKVTKLTFPKLTGQLVGGFEHIYPYDEENVFVPTEQGFVHFNPKKLNQDRDSLFTHINEIKLGDSTIIYGGYHSDNLIKPSFEPEHNTFTFNFASSSFSELDIVEFQYKLEGFDQKWSPWLKKNFKEYTSLPHGDYNFKIKSRNSNGQYGKIDSYPFSINPPWYLTWIAKFVYFFLTVIALMAIYVVPLKIFERKKSGIIQEQEEVLQEATEEYEKIVAENQAEISKLQEEKLRTEIQFKNKELASTTMHLVQKGSLLNKLKERLQTIQKNSTDSSIKKEIRSTLRLINQSSQIDEDWEQFANYFDQVHVDFLRRIKEVYPNLTPKDLKMCTYLKMNLSTKEIVPLMNISVRGVEVSRYRLRKKLGLESNVNLNDFMMRF